MKPAKCTQCGGFIEVDENRDAGICSFCGTPFVTEKVINNYVTNYNTVNNITNINYGEPKDGSREFSQAITQLKLGDFDAACFAIEKATNRAPENPKYWIYDFYIETHKLQKIPVEWCSGGYDKSKPVSARIKSVSNFFALATEEDKKTCSAEIGIDLSNFNRFAAGFMSSVAKVERQDGTVMHQELAWFAADVFLAAADEDKALVADAVIKLMCSYGVVFGVENFQKKHNQNIISVLNTVKDYVKAEDRDRVSNKINPITYGNRLNVFAAEFCRGFENGRLTPDSSITNVSLNIDGV